MVREATRNFAHASDAAPRSSAGWARSPASNRPFELASQQRLDPSRAPQTPRPRAELFCNLCAYNVARGSKHCRACDKCVLHFDHHCKWLNNCVGSKNYHSFFLLVSTVLFQVLAQMAAGAYQLQQYNVPAAAYGAQTQAAHAYDPNAAQAAAAEWGQAPQAQAPQQTAPQQTGEWQTHYSEGRAYYYNVATGETRWA